MNVKDPRFGLGFLLNKWRAEKELCDYSRVFIEAVEPDRRTNQAPYIVFRAAVRDSDILEEAAEKVIKLLDKDRPVR